MLGENQTLSISPAIPGKVGIRLALATYYSNGNAVLITHHVDFPEDEDPQKYIMAIEAAIIYLQKKTENSSY
jgi:hypothetical protein